MPLKLLPYLFPIARLARSLIVTWIIVVAQATDARCQGKVYLVLGSDTAIWDGMDVARFSCTYAVDLYVDQFQNASKVMDHAFRGKMVDSYGQPVKLTWWMMGGNIFRYATNQNVPIANTLTLYLMQKYHGPAIRQFGDELSLHYHTFAWTDYNRDGMFYWNQARSFEECRADFDYTMAQYLLEENVYPVSFRSGWHAMDNPWQRYLDELLPFSMHNDWPSKRTDPTEPIDNEYDWSRSPSTWVPFHPSPNDYQVPGTCRGWNLRSKHIGSVTASLMDTIFARAQRGVDQVACFWGHLPEADFLTNLLKVDSIAHRSASTYPGATFRYCTAVEAMQRWIQTTDHEPPRVLLLEEPYGDEVYFTIQTDEPIFQRQPFVAAKDVYGQFACLRCLPIGPNVWRTEQPLSRGSLAKLGVAVTDSVGNLQKIFKVYLPDDQYCDDEEGMYEELRGNWGTVATRTWGRTSRVATLAATDSVKARWRFAVSRSGRHSAFAQIPPTANGAGGIFFRLSDEGGQLDTVLFQNPLTPKTWIYLSSPMLTSGGVCTVEVVVKGDRQPGKTVGVDVVKLSALVPERQLAVDQHALDFGEVCEGDTVTRALALANHGTSTLTVTDLLAQSRPLIGKTSLPITIRPMSSVSIPVSLAWPFQGTVLDTLVVVSDDPIQPRMPVVLTATVRSYFLVVDNDDSLHYAEEGPWAKSTAQAYGATSRYAYVSSLPVARATFTAVLRRSGIYDLQQIVPQTVNAADKALYMVSIEGIPIDSLVIDQNAGSGAWVTIRRRSFPGGKVIAVRVIDTGRNTAGRVLRADALRFQWVDQGTMISERPSAAVPGSFSLHQNYPNPFNASTRILFSVLQRSIVHVSITNTLGQELARIADGEFELGTYEVIWNPSKVATGTYFCRFEATPIGRPGDQVVQVRRMLLLR